VTWEYVGPEDSDKDQVRFYIGDVDVDRPMLSDEEIQFLLDSWLPVHGSVLMVSAVACEVLAGRFAREVSVSADGVSVSVSELQGKYELLATSLRDQARAQMAGSPILPGLLGVEPDPTIPPLVFGVGFMDNHLAGRQDYGDRALGPGYLEEGV
jgi:hypothetical protein